MYFQWSGSSCRRNGRRQTSLPVTTFLHPESGYCMLFRTWTWSPWRTDGPTANNGHLSLLWGAHLWPDVCACLPMRYAVLLQRALVARLAAESCRRSASWTSRRVSQEWPRFSHRCVRFVACLCALVNAVGWSVRAIARWRERDDSESVRKRCRRRPTACWWGRASGPSEGGNGGPWTYAVHVATCRCKPDGKYLECSRSTTAPNQAEGVGRNQTNPRLRIPAAGKAGPRKSPPNPGDAKGHSTSGTRAHRQRYLPSNKTHREHLIPSSQWMPRASSVTMRDPYRYARYRVARDHLPAKSAFECYTPRRQRNM